MSPRDPPAVGLSRGAWRAQRQAARQRGIEFLLTFEEWRDWWIAELANRGGGPRGLLRSVTGTKSLKMCRVGDQGPYALGNIYCGTAKQNSNDVAPEKRRHGNYWLRGVTGAAHPRSKEITTEAGTFPTLTAAAQHYGISTTELRRRMCKGVV